MQNTAAVEAQPPSTKPASCVGCPYYLREGIQWGTGHPQARIAFVEGAFSGGGSSNILDNACRREQINRHREFTTALVKCKVGANEPLDYRAVSKCRPLLDAELNNLPDLRVVVTLGEAAFREFTGKSLTTVTSRKDIKKWMRGCPYPFGYKKVIIPLLHPLDYARTGFVTSFEFDTDMGKVRRFANGQGRFYKVKANYSPTNSEAEEYIREIQRLGRGGLDIETPEDADEDELAAGGQLLPIDVIGLSANPDEAIGLRPDQYHLLRNAFQDRTQPTKWYVFNAAFDFYHLGKTFGELEGVRVRDAMLDLSVWRSDLRKKDLGTLLSFFSDLPYTKNLAKVDPIRYQWADTCGVLEAGLNLEAVLEFQGLLKVSLRDHQLIADLTGEYPDGLNKMREVGVRTDIREVFKLLTISKQMLAKYEEVWSKYFPMVDWQSPKQLGELFTGPLGLPVIMKTRKKKKDGEVVVTKTPSCDVDALEEYRDKYGNKTADLVLKMRTIKHLGDFAGIIRPDTNRIHTGYAIHRQIQRRIQAFDPNIQTLPEELAGFHTRKMVIPDTEDDIIISMDASQLELRIYAWLSNAQNLLKAMNSGEYIYGTMYEQIYKRPYWKDPSAPHTKQNKADYVTVQEVLAAKSGPLGFIYDRYWKSLVAQLGMEPTLAEQSYKGFHGQNPEIQEFHKRVDASVKKLGYQDNLWGARRYFPTPRIQRPEYLSFHGQSNGGEVLRDNYLIPSFRGLKDFGARVLLTVHDSMALNVPKRNLLTTAQFLYDNAERPIPEMNGFVIPCELKWGPNWADTKPFKTTKDERGRTVVIAE